MFDAGLTPEEADIFIIEDDINISSLITLYLNRVGYCTAHVFDNAEEALNELKRKGMPDLILLDLTLPGMSGLEFLNHLQEIKREKPPILVVSAKDDDQEMINCFDDGAIDYITKPFSPQVLIAKIKSILKRRTNVTKKDITYNFGEYTLHRDTCTVTLNGQVVPLSVKEYNILDMLTTYENKILPPSMIFDEIWKGTFGDTSAVAVYVQRLRKKFAETSSSEDFIRTYFGKGYMFSRDFSKVENDNTIDSVYNNYLANNKKLK